MMFVSKRPRRVLAWLVCWCLALPLFPSEAAAQKRVIVVNAEQPNLWTLEQAHYLLAQMHRRNLDLKAKSLESLDPNEINGLRFDVMRMLVEFGATFNQADLETNRLLSATRTFDSGRRQELLTERDQLRREALRLTGEIETLESEKADAEDEDAKKKLDARITAKNTRLARVDKEVEQLNGELATLPAQSGTPTATTGGATFNAEKQPKSTFDEAFQKAAAAQIEKFNNSPKLNASLRLDNFLQMQYEIISKQLSLLRDELGPGERLVFLELPQTVNAAHHEANRKWAQSWWKVVGYTRRERTSAAPMPRQSPPLRVNENQEPISITQDMNSILKGQGIPVLVNMPPCAAAIPDPVPYSDTKVIRVVDAPPPPPTTPVTPAPPTPTPKRRQTGGKTPTPAQTPTPAPLPTPNPSSITIPKTTDKVRKVTVTLNGLSHPNPDDLDIMLVGPQGQNAIIMSDVGGSNPVQDVTITLDDSATEQLPDATALSSRTYRPSDAEPGADKFLKPAPLGGSALSVFNGTDPTGQWSLFLVDDNGTVEGSISGGWSLNIATDCRPEEMPMEVTYKDKFINLDEFTQNGSALWQDYLSKPGAMTRLENRMVRTVELIPRQSSLNVNDMNMQVKAGAFNFVLSTLFGFGSSLNVQRQREQFSQFVQQELYSAAFGKGAREFGWTFTPMPGTDRLLSGVRTTYAVLVVPEEASSIVLESNGCYFPRSYYPPSNFADSKNPEWNVEGRTSRNCGGTISKSFVVPIPSAEVSGGNDFWVKGVSFQPVAKGKRVVVSVSGKNFSPQTGVLINGIPLVHSIGLAQPLIRDDSEAGRLTREEFKDSEIPGTVERIDSNRIIFSFKMPPDFQGTPTITLVAPGRAVDLNWLTNININGGTGVPLKDFAPKMFGHGPSPEAFRIDKVRVHRNHDNPRVLTAVITGAGFLDNSGKSTIGTILVNGDLFEPNPPPNSPSLMRVNFYAPKDETIKITLVSSDPKKLATIESDAVPNPAFISVADVEVTTYETDKEDEVPTLLVKIKGTGFTDKLRASVEGKALPIAVKSATEAVFTMPDPKAAAIVTIEDDAGQKAKIVVTRKTKKQ